MIFLRAPQWPYDDPDRPASIAFRALRQVHPWPAIDPGKELAHLAAETHHDPRTFANGRPMMGHLNRYGDAVLGRMLADEIGRVFFLRGGRTGDPSRGQLADCPSPAVNGNEARPARGPREWLQP